MPTLAPPRSSTTAALAVSLAIVASGSPPSAAAPGDFDTSFGGGADVVPFNAVTNGVDVATALAVGPSGAMVLGGSVQTGSSGPEYHGLGFARIETDGSLADKWGTLGDGRSRLSFDPVDDDRPEPILDLAIGPDEKVVAVGYARGLFLTSPFAFAVRLNTIGTPDSSFTGDGKYALPVGSSAVAVGVDREGRAVTLVVKYGTFGGIENAWVVRLAASSATDDPGSALDSDFADNGILGIGPEIPADLLVLPDDRVLVATNDLLEQMGRLRLLMSNGLPDESFGGGDGIFDPDISFDGFASELRALALDPKGRIVALGLFYDPDPIWALARFTIDGSFDTEFGSQGVATFGYDVSLPYTPRSIAVQSDGKIVVGGDENGSSYLARFEEDGDLDTTFAAPDGQRLVFYDAAFENSTATAVAIGGDGRVLVAGSNQFEKTVDRDFGVARFESGVVFCDGFESQGIYGESRWSATVP